MSEGALEIVAEAVTAFAGALLVTNGATGDEERFITEATALGVTPREVVRFLARRIKEGD